MLPHQPLLPRRYAECYPVLGLCNAGSGMAMVVPLGFAWFFPFWRGGCFFFFTRNARDESVAYAPIDHGLGMPGEPRTPCRSGFSGLAVRPGPLLCTRRSSTSPNGFGKEKTRSWRGPIVSDIGRNHPESHTIQLFLVSQLSPRLRGFSPRRHHTYYHIKPAAAVMTMISYRNRWSNAAWTMIHPVP